MFSRAETAEPLGSPATRRWRWLPDGYRRRRWMFIGLLALVALALGSVGLTELRVPSGTTGAERPIPVPDLLYYLLGLFRFASPPVDPPYPAALEVARWIAPLSLVLAGLGAIAAVFTEQFVQLRVYLWYRNHWVICGAGRVGMRLAVTFRDRRVRVVLVDHEPAPADVEQCRRVGVPLFVGDATDPVVLERARVRRASHLVVVTGDDGVNTEVAQRAGRVAGKGPEQLDVYVNVDDEELSLLLDQGAMFRPRRRGRASGTTRRRPTGLHRGGARPVEYRFFNVLRLGPRALLSDRPEILEGRGDRPPSVLVVGAGSIGVNLAVEAVHRWGIENGEGDPRLHITLADANAQATVAAMKERWPRFGRICELSPLAVDPFDPYADPFGGGFDLSEVTAVVVCPGDDAAGLRVSVLLRRRLAAEVPIIVCTTKRNDGGSMLDLASVGHGNLERYSVLDKVCEHWVDLVLAGPSVDEDLARGIHAFYVRHRRDDGLKGDASMAPWDVIPEDLRESARRQAIDFRVKIARLGYTVAPALEAEPEPFTFSPNEVELLARMEHDRFVAERLGAGWVYAPTRDVKNRQSPYLVCWECLGEQVREYDREAVRDFPHVLAREGYSVVPVGGAGHLAVPESLDVLDPDWVCPTCARRHAALPASLSPERPLDVTTS
ncbi:MAG TPA: NAD-binding protein [Acidimicrobiales bacterium]|nr:NAD-binding protein [Acidimicrobiales bacterium]